MPNQRLREVLDLAKNEQYPEEERLHEVVSALEGLLDEQVEQALALLTRVKQNKVVRVYVDPFGLPEGYLLVHELGDDPTGAPAFECGIALDGSVSS